MLVAAARGGHTVGICRGGAGAKTEQQGITVPQ
jgi:hypothetical protein